MADPQQGKAQGKVLGMPRTTGIIVLALGAVVVGYFVISKFSGSSGGGGSSQGGGGARSFTYIIRDWQGHRPRPRPHPGGKRGGG